MPICSSPSEKRSRTSTTVVRRRTQRATSAAAPIVIGPQETSATSYDRHAACHAANALSAREVTTRRTKRSWFEKRMFNARTAMPSISPAHVRPPGRRSDLS